MRWYEGPVYVMGYLSIVSGWYMLAIWLDKMTGLEWPILLQFFGQSITYVLYIRFIRARLRGDWTARRIEAQWNVVHYEPPVFRI
jgi:hypothetical protein